MVTMKPSTKIEKFRTPGTGAQTLGERQDGQDGQNIFI